LADGDLREDLYYRLAVVQIDLPPLRERSQDVQLLATEFLERFSGQNGKRLGDFDTPAWEWILSYNWPGNVRELKNAVERAVIMARGDKIALNDIMPRHLRNTSEVPSTVTIRVGATVSDARRQLVLRTFASTGGDSERTAKLLGVSVDDVRGDMTALINGSGGDGGSNGSAPTDPGGKAGGGPAKKNPPGKKR
jgi:transcriptional regulator with PAS, ATPase and Fis domain